MCGAVDRGVRADSALGGVGICAPGKLPAMHSLIATGSPPQPSAHRSLRRVESALSRKHNLKLSKQLKRLKLSDASTDEHTLTLLLHSHVDPPYNTHAARATTTPALN